MQRYGGAAIPMRQNSKLDSDAGTSASPLEGVTWLLGSAGEIGQGKTAPALEPFAPEMLDFLNEVSRELMANREAKRYPDVVTFAFWIRKSSTLKLKERFCKEDGNIHLGRGLAFHIAPSNVPVNFAYSLTAGLLTGNANVVRVPSKDFPQVDAVKQAFCGVMDREAHKFLKPYVALVRYGRNKEINNYFSSIADTRIVWGGDDTVREIRQSSLAPRAGEITFADRYSIAVIDSGTYLNAPDKMRIAKDFYNDTFLSDQNACTSPKLIAWLGGRRSEAKDEFWANLHKLAESDYNFQSIMGVNKLFSSCLAAVAYAAGGHGQSGAVILPRIDNRIVRVKIPGIISGLMDLKDNSGYFFEYDCDDILELKSLCDDKRCQTIAYIGDKKMLTALLRSGICGVDRVVPVGKTMDFDLIWDGYDLYERLTRTISIV